MRVIRDRGDASFFDEPQTIAPYYIEAKLHHTHKGVGSWAMVQARTEQEARTKYLKDWPQRVIVKITRKEKVVRRVVRER